MPIDQDDRPDWLLAVRGNVRRLFPSRLWFVAWRRQATGAVVVRDHALSVRIGLRRGEIVDVLGLPDLAATLQPPGTSADTLTAAVGGAMAMGHSLDKALGHVAGDVGRWMVRVQQGDARFDAAWTPGAGAIPVPGTPVRLLTQIVAEVPGTALEATWQSALSSRVQARQPGDVPAERWGLDPAGLRAHRLATGQSVHALCVELSGGDASRRLAVLRTIDVLLRLGLVALRG